MPAMSRKCKMQAEMKVARQRLSVLELAQMLGKDLLLFTLCSNEAA